MTGTLPPALYPDDPPAKKPLSVPVALLMIAIIGTAWTIAACLGSGYVFYGMIADTPRLLEPVMAGMMADIVDDYMLHMMYRNPERAYWSFTYDGTTDVSPGDLQSLIDDHYYLFEGYDHLKAEEVEGLPEMDLFSGEDFNAQDSVITVRGTVYYLDGAEGAFTAVLVGMGDEGWLLRSVEVTPPPERIEE